MEHKIQTEQGDCYASIKSETEVQAIQADLEGAAWLPQTTTWVEAVKDPTRFKMVFLLFQHDRLCGCDLANILGITNSAVSQHLRKLRDMGLVTHYRHKQTLFYNLDDDDFLAFFSNLIPHEAHHERIIVGT